jgi:hypothetical protein
MSDAFTINIIKSVNDASKIVIYNSRVMLQIVVSLTDDSRGVIFYCNMFMAQATVSGYTIRQGGPQFFLN